MGEPILLAIDHTEALDVMCRFLEERHFNIVKASTYDEALAVAQNVTLKGMVAVSNWLVSDEGENTELTNLVVSKIPVVMLAKKGRGYAWFELYRIQPPNMMDYCSVPFGVQEVLFLMKRVGIA